MNNTNAKYKGAFNFAFTDCQLSLAQPLCSLPLSMKDILRFQPGHGLLTRLYRLPQIRSFFSIISKPGVFWKRCAFRFELLEQLAVAEIHLHVCQVSCLGHVGSKGNTKARAIADWLRGVYARAVSQHRTVVKRERGNVQVIKTTKPMGKSSRKKTCH